MPRALAVDLGSRRIGIAISDDKGKVATPYATLDRTSDEYDVQAIAEIANAEGAAHVIVGLPLSLDGTRGHAAAVSETFAEKLKNAGVKVKLWDERMTTIEASKKLKGRGMSNKKARTVVDKMAATVLLQSFLDSKKR